MNDTTLLLAFVAGILSFLSPCILPIIPGFMAYLSGTSGQENLDSNKDSNQGPGQDSNQEEHGSVQKSQSPKKTSRYGSFMSSVMFVLGFSFVFAILGVVLNSALASSSYVVRLWLSRIGGTIIILFGLHVTGLVQIPFLMMEHKIEVKKTRNHFLTSFIFGASFAVGWSPCVGAILGSVLALAVSNPGMSFVLLMAYALGLGVPFLIVGWFTESAITLVKRSRAILKYFNIVVGILLILIGIMVFTDNLVLIGNFIVPQGLIQ